MRLTGKFGSCAFLLMLFLEFFGRAFLSRILWLWVSESKKGGGFPFYLFLPLYDNDTLPELVDFDVRKVVVADCDRI